MNMKHSPTEIHCDICIITCMFWTYVNSCTVCHFSNTVELNWGNLCSVVKSKISNMMGDLINLCILCCSGTVMSMIAKNIIRYSIGPVQFLIRLTVDLSKLPDSVSLIGNVPVSLFLVLDTLHIFMSPWLCQRDWACPHNSICMLLDYIILCSHRWHIVCNVLVKTCLATLVWNNEVAFTPGPVTT